MRTLKRLTPAVSAIAITAGLFGCTAPTPSTQPQSNNAAECITAFNADTDYFPVKTSFELATGVKVEYHKSYKVVTVNQPLSDAAPESYVLVQCGAPKPDLTGDLAGAQVINVPAKKVASSSTTQLPAFEMLDRVGSLAGVEAPDMVNGEKIRSAISAGTVKGYGTPAGQLSVEKIAAINPDLFLSSGTPDQAYDKIKELGIPVVGNAEWLETSPLGRAEWLKFTALFLNAEQEANEQFKDISQHYNEIKASAANVTDRPTVLTGAPFKGTWYLASGESYLANFIKDAGATYAFADLSGVKSTASDLETVLAKASGAQIWINPSQTATKISDLMAEDPRFGNIRAVTDGQVWNPTLRVSPGGGSDYWEQGVARPDLVLGDLIEAFHPGTLKDHSFTFYKKLDR